MDPAAPFRFVKCATPLPIGFESHRFWRDRPMILFSGYLLRDVAQAGTSRFKRNVKESGQVLAIPGAADDYC